ncbi:SDR family NAD(P)-dependent oxidoreductase [Streptomyces sp. NBC_00988]|uniref:SDR family NAD(P)-dependent oxidoreductase n=1 Tax=Streptomyces sp. NBC_00988 TaxID=2903704 RepID=UPI0038708256|nr:SDR family NAD(P)-dependent oxidoreductase [Streptomyces sp. NBC_00988]
MNLSSLGGLVRFGATGSYHVSKCAMEGLSESLAAELAPLSVNVTTVEPAAFRTQLVGALHTPVRHDHR